MLNLYLSDLYKLRKSTAMKVLLGIAIICAVTVAIMAFEIYKGSISKNLLGINFLLSDISMVNILGAVIAGVFICGDFDNRSIHEAIANGNSRGALLVGKTLSFITALLAVILPYAIVTGVAIGTGSKFSMGTATAGFAHLLTNEAGKNFTAAMTGKLLLVMLTLIIVYIGQLSLCILFSILFKKPVVVVALSYVLGILSGQLQTLKNASKVFERVISCTPFLGDYNFLSIDSSSGDLFKAAAVSILFAAVILLITYFIFRKSEIK